MFNFSEEQALFWAAINLVTGLFFAWYLNSGGYFFLFSSGFYSGIWYTQRAVRLKK